MFKELYNQLLQDLLGSLFRELKDIQQSDNWLGDKIISSIPYVWLALLGLIFWFIPVFILNILVHVLTALSAIFALPFYWLAVKSERIRKRIILNALHEEQRKSEEVESSNKQ